MELNRLICASVKGALEGLTLELRRNKVIYGALAAITGTAIIAVASEAGGAAALNMLGEVVVLGSLSLAAGLVTAVALGVIVGGATTAYRLLR